MKGWRIVIVLLLCLILAGSLACDVFGGGKEEVISQQVKVVRGDLTVTVSGSGNVAISKEARLSFGSGGKVEKIFVDEGDNVSEGDVLAQLDTSSLEQALSQAKLTLAQAKAARREAEYNLKHLRDIVRASSDRIEVAESKLKAAEAQVETAEQGVAHAQKQLDEATITATFNGLVASVAAKEGDTVPPPTMAPTVIIYLIDLATMELSAEVDEIDIAEVKPGQRVVIEVDALPALQLEGKVISISLLPEVEAGVVLYEVKIGFDAPQDLELKVGMSATADIITSERSNVLLVPDRAITSDSQGNPVVNVVVNEQIEERPVVIGISDGFQTEIVDGLDGGEVVVVERRAKK